MIRLRLSRVLKERGGRVRKVVPAKMIKPKTKHTDIGGICLKTDNNYVCIHIIGAYLNYMID